MHQVYSALLPVFLSLILLCPPTVADESVIERQLCITLFNFIIDDHSRIFSASEDDRNREICRRGERHCQLVQSSNRAPHSARLDADHLKGLPNIEISTLRSFVREVEASGGEVYLATDGNDRSSFSVNAEGKAVIILAQNSSPGTLLHERKHWEDWDSLQKFLIRRRMVPSSEAGQRAFELLATPYGRLVLEARGHTESLKWYLQNLEFPDAMGSDARTRFIANLIPQGNYPLTESLQAAVRALRRLRNLESLDGQVPSTALLAYRDRLSTDLTHIQESMMDWIIRDTFSRRRILSGLYQVGMMAGFLGTNPTAQKFQRERDRLQQAPSRFSDFFNTDTILPANRAAIESLLRNRLRLYQSQNPFDQ